MRGRKSGSGTGPSAGDGSRRDPPSPELRRALQVLQEVLQSVRHPRAAEVGVALGLADRDVPAFWRVIDGNAWWAGVGSIAAETLGDNPGLHQTQWDATVRELRTCLVEIGEVLLARNPHNPGISSWVLAFRNWNDSEV